MIKFNMNNYVWFEPTELGKKVYEDYHKSYGLNLELKTKGGVTSLQFHEFIQIYGDYITSYICKDKEVFKNYEFWIDEGKLL